MDGITKKTKQNDQLFKTFLWRIATVHLAFAKALAESIQRMCKRERVHCDYVVAYE